VELSPPGVVPTYTLYDVASDDTDHETVTWPLPAVAVRPVGAAGVEGCGVTAE
jgi:hypothetical protein